MNERSIVCSYELSCDAYRGGSDIPPPPNTHNTHILQSRYCRRDSRNIHEFPALSKRGEKFKKIKLNEREGARAFVSKKLCDIIHTRNENVDGNKNKRSHAELRRKNKIKPGVCVCV